MSKKQTYFIVCDPCYITPNKEWDKMGKETDWELENLSFPRKVDKGIKLRFISHTAHGDGYFAGIGVDSGTLCVAELENLKIVDKISYQVKPDYISAVKFCIDLALNHF